MGKYGKEQLTKTHYEFELYSPLTSLNNLSSEKMKRATWEHKGNLTMLHNWKAILLINIVTVIKNKIMGKQETNPLVQEGEKDIIASYNYLKGNDFNDDQIALVF